MKSIAETLFQHQTQNKLTQQQMAHLLGISQATYNNWVNHKAIIDPKHYPTIAKICQLADTSILSSSTSLQLVQNPASAGSINPLELYQTFTAPLYEIINILKKEVEEKDATLFELKSEIERYKRSSLE